ncbi:MAG: FadR/GntR family transcriptional regulator [Pseudomonadota bacterium]
MDIVTNWQPKTSYSARTIHGFLVRKLGVSIVSGVYPAGAMMPVEAELLKENGVSRTAMREAIKILTAKGLLESRPRVGLRVRQARDWNLLDPDVLGWYCECGGFADIAPKLIQMRCMVEPFAAGIAATQHTQAQIEHLESCYEAMARARNLEDWITSDLSFHEAILAATGNELLIPLGNMIREGLRIMFGVSAESTKNPFYSLPLHKAVLDAIKARDPLAAQSAMQAILDGSALTIAQKQAG